MRVCQTALWGSYHVFSEGGKVQFRTIFEQNEVFLHGPRLFIWHTLADALCSSTHCIVGMYQVRYCFMYQTCVSSTCVAFFQQESACATMEMSRFIKDSLYFLVLYEGKEHGLLTIVLSPCTRRWWWILKRRKLFFGYLFASLNTTCVVLRVVYVAVYVPESCYAFVVATERA